MTTYVCSIPFYRTSNDASNHIILYVPVYKSVTGYKGLFYIVDGFRYHIRFPIKWALNHKILSGIFTGPKECLNCVLYGTCNTVFVGYCDNCLRHYSGTNEIRGDFQVSPGKALDMLNNDELIQKYPYIKGTIVSEVEEIYEFNVVEGLWSEIVKNMTAENDAFDVNGEEAN